jgi:hypothetical protein
MAPFPALAGHLVGVIEAHSDDLWTGICQLGLKEWSQMKLGGVFRGELTGCGWMML